MGNQLEVTNRSQDNLNWKKEKPLNISDTGSAEFLSNLFCYLYKCTTTLLPV